MDENVIYPPNQDSDQNSAEQDPAAPATDVPAEEPVDPNAPTSEEVAVGGEPPPETPADTEVTSDEAPPPSRAGLIKKVLIGLGILIVIIFLIILLIPKNQAPKEVTLEWWGLWEDARAVQSVIDDFEKANPTIKIKYVNSDPKQYLGRLKTRIQNGTGPDVFRYHNSWMPMLTEVLLPLSANVITLDDFKKNYPPVMQSDLTRNGAIYGIPLEGDTLAMFANTELFDKAGLQVPGTWEEFVDTSRKLTVKDADTGKIKTAGAALGTFTNISHASDIVSMLFVQGGIDINKITEPANTQKEESAMEFYTSFALGDQAVWDSTLDQSILAFSRGNLGLYFGYSWDVFRIQTINKSLQYKIYPVPGLQGGKNATIASYWVEGASSKGKNQREAYLFMKYLAQKETSQKLYTQQSKVRAFGEPYARKDLGETVKDNPQVYPFISQLPYASSTYFSSDTYDGEGGLNSALNAYLGNAVTELAATGKSPTSSVKTMNAGIFQVYKKYAIK